MNIISKTANINESVKIGNFCTIDDNVKIGKGCVIGNNVVIHKDAQIGENIRIDDGVIIGKMPMKAANSQTTKDEELNPTVISDNCIIGTHVVVYRGANIGQKVLIADLSTVRENVNVGEFTIVGRGVAIENYCNIGKRVKLETNVYITAYSDVEDNCFVAPCVATSNDNFAGRDEERKNHFRGVHLKKGARVGLNSTILPGKVVNEDGFVAAGSVVTKDVESENIVAGNPARFMKKVDSKQLLKNQ